MKDEGRRKPETRNQKPEGKTYRSARASSPLVSGFWFLVSSNLLRLVLPKQTRRTEKQDGNQDDEGDGVAVVRELAAADERFDDADDQPAQHGAGHVSDAAKNRGDE